MKIQRKSNKQFKANKMRKLIFQPETYILTDEVINSVKTGRQFLKPKDSFIGVFELLQSSIDNSPLQGLTKKDFKVIKRLKKSLKTIARYKDADEDSMCIKEGGPYELVIEEDEYEIILRLFNAMTEKLVAKVSDEVDTVYEILGNAEQFTPTKPELVKE